MFSRHQSRITASQSTLVAIIRTNLLAAIIADLSLNYKHLLTIDDTYRFLIAAGNRVAQEIDLATRFFEKTYIRPTLSETVMREVREDYPTLVMELHKWEFPIGMQALGNDILDLNVNKTGEITFVSIGSIGFSFGSNIYLLTFLLARILLRLPCKLVIYLPPSDIGVFTELSRIAGKAYSFITVRDLFSYEFSIADLIECRQSGGTTYMLNYLKLALNETYGLQSSLSNGKHIPHKLCCASDSLQSLMHLATRSFLRKLGFQESRNIAADCRLSGLMSFRPIAIIANRDHIWAGPGQPWRDSPIKSYHKIIQFLLAHGYSVVRLNLSGEPSSILDKNFFDFASLTGITPEIQMEVIAKAKFVIGADTGITGVAQLGGSLPTLVVDGPDLKPHEPWSQVMCHTKILSIDDEVLFHSHEKHYLKSILCSPESFWCIETCRKIGLKLAGLSDDEMLNGLEEFLDCIENNRWHSKQSLAKLGLTSISGYDTIISTQTADMLASVLGV